MINILEAIEIAEIQAKSKREAELQKEKSIREEMKLRITSIDDFKRRVLAQLMPLHDVNNWYIRDEIDSVYNLGYIASVSHNGTFIGNVIMKCTDYQIGIDGISGWCLSLWFVGEIKLWDRVECYSYKSPISLIDPIHEIHDISLSKFERENILIDKFINKLADYIVNRYNR